MADVMARLKQETWDLHTRTEKHPFQHGMLTGSLPREAYVAYLGQLLLVHRALEARLKEHAAERPVAQVVQEYQFQEPYLLEDLASFGVEAAELEPLAGTRSLIEAIEEADAPLGLMGMHYVLEGSNNGGRFIARAVGRAYGLEPGRGLRYLDPYGEDQRSRWGRFREDMDGCGFSPAEGEALIAGANAMFLGMIAMFDSLADRFGVGEPVAG